MGCYELSGIGKKGGEKEHDNGCPDCFLANFFNEMRRRMDIDPHSSQPKERNTVGKKICSKLPNVPFPLFAVVFSSNSPFDSILFKCLIISVTQ